jgi:hypothetical protein
MWQHARHFLYQLGQKFLQNSLKLKGDFRACGSMLSTSCIDSARNAFNRGRGSGLLGEDSLQRGGISLIPSAGVGSLRGSVRKWPLGRGQSAGARSFRVSVRKWPPGRGDYVDKRHQYCLQLVKVISEVLWCSWPLGRGQSVERWRHIVLYL